MNVVDLLKKGKVNCPGCQRVFEIGPDLEALTESAGTLLDKLGNFLGGAEDDDTEELELTESLGVELTDLLKDLGKQYELDADDTQDALARALDDGGVLEALFHFLDNEEDDDED